MKTLDYHSSRRRIPPLIPRKVAMWMGMSVILLVLLIVGSAFHRYRYNSNLIKSLKMLSIPTDVPLFKGKMSSSMPRITDGLTCWTSESWERCSSELLGLTSGKALLATYQNQSGIICVVELTGLSADRIEFRVTSFSYSGNMTGESTSSVSTSIFVDLPSSNWSTFSLGLRNRPLQSKANERCRAYLKLDQEMYELIFSEAASGELITTLEKVKTARSDGVTE